MSCAGRASLASRSFSCEYIASCRRSKLTFHCSRSATIDPSLFCSYFQDPLKQLPCPTLEIPGRTFPVKKHYLNEIVQMLRSDSVPFLKGGWVFEEKDVRNYLEREMRSPLPAEIATKTDDPLKLPSALIGLVIAHVARRTRQTRDGHILGESSHSALSPQLTRLSKYSCQGWRRSRRYSGSYGTLSSPCLMSTSRDTRYTSCIRPYLSRNSRQSSLLPRKAFSVSS